MNHFTTVVLAAAAAFAISTTATAHRPDDFDGGKKADFKLAAAKNKARMLDTSGASVSAFGAASRSAATTTADSSQKDDGITFAPCRQGVAAGLYTCNNVDMLAHVDIDELGVTFVNDIWGWTDPKTRREYALVGATEGTVVVDVTFSLRPRVLGILPAAKLDEFFEAVSTTTTRLWDMHDLQNPRLIAETTNGQTSIDHNLYTRGKFAFAANYTTGLRIFDTSKVGKGRYDEIAFFDVYPENDNATFEGGAWSNYPYFKRRNVIAVSSIDRGLFLLRPRLRWSYGDGDEDD